MANFFAPQSVCGPPVTFLFEGISKKMQNCEKIKDDNEYFEQRDNIFDPLLEKKVFENVLKEEYQDDLDAYFDIYQLMLGWVDIDRSWLLTCQVGAIGNNKDYAEGFYSSFIFPFFNDLFFNEKKYYYNINSFFCNDFPREKYAQKRFLLIKFKGEGVELTSAMALCGYIKVPVPQPPVKEPGQSIVPAQKQKCIMM